MEMIIKGSSYPLKYSAAHKKAARQGFTLGTLQEFANQLCRFPYDASALQPFVPTVKAFHLITVFPVYLDNFPTRNPSVVFHDLFPEPIEELVSIGPHSGVLLFLLPAAAEPETNGR
jgi:hypothetical protein